ncbi:MAG: threonine--tRNA ligase [Flavobacteriales bacterium]|jgi:threonyl-tRNA synthetase|nr:threonine--tRNA ligase [Flavobacteriales bacterium]
MIKVTLPDNSVKEFEAGINSIDVAQSISAGLARNVIAAEINGEIWDATRPISEDVNIKLLTFNDEGGKYAFWHSSAHLMAEAIEELFPGVKFAIGPPIENGFYYDIDLGEKNIHEADLKKLEDKMMELARQKNDYIRKEISKDEAIAYFTEKNDPYKLELLEGLEDGSITFYTQGGFTDLCRGPHIPNTGIIKAVKLTNISGAFWRGDQTKQQLTRVYGVSFPKAKLLKEHLALLEEAKKRDHRKIGKEMDLFHFSQRVGLGLPLWLPKGAMLRERLERFMRNAQMERGYDPVVTPHIGNVELYKTSGHFEKYGEDAFQTIKTPSDNEEFMLKPMNCPHHCEIYNSRPRSYRDLPLRLAEFGTVYRYEQSGELHGLSRVRGFTQDDAHLFCRPDQVQDEFEKVIDLVSYTFNALGFEEFIAQISLRDPENPEKYIGEDENWEKAENAIIQAAKNKELNTVVEYGEAAFYGPKLDFMVKDALGRKWQLGTIQVDYNLPERFNLTYVGSDNQKHRPVMIHRAPFGSLERFIGILIEHTGGDFPLWLNPDQVIILPISEKYHDYANKVLHLLKNSDIRAEIDERAEKIGKKIFDAEKRKVPFLLIIGEKESESDTVAVRKPGKIDLGVLSIEEFKNLVQKEIQKDFE